MTEDEPRAHIPSGPQPELKDSWLPGPQYADTWGPYYTAMKDGMSNGSPP